MALTNKKLIGARDPLGIRPLVLGELDGSPVLCSETCALDIIGAKFVRDVEHGESRGHRQRGREELLPPFPAAGAALHLRICLFRQAGLDRERPLRLRRPQARWERSWRGKRRPSRRRRAGARLRRSRGDRLRPAPAACPSRWASSATTMSGAPSFSRPSRFASLACRMKHNANRAVLEGKRVVLIDNSIVRGTTSVKIMQMMREAGAREVHLRICLAADRLAGLLRHRHARARQAARRAHGPRGDAAIRSASTASRFLSVDGLYRAMGYPGRDARQPQFTDHYFTGDYPTRLRRSARRAGPPAIVASGGSELIFAAHFQLQ